jgi:hypothetical protein
MAEWPHGYEEDTFLVLGGLDMGELWIHQLYPRTEGQIRGSALPSVGPETSAEKLDANAQCFGM